MKKENKAPKMAKQRLGRGLSALLADHSEEDAVPPTTLPIERMEVNPDQPRKIFREENLQELVLSIQNQGILQPIIVRPSSDKTGYYQIIAGERRWRAAMKAGLHRLPVVIKDATEDETLVMSLVENIQRDDLSTLEEARAYERLMLLQQLTQKELAQLVGKSRSVIANALRLLSLPKNVQEMVDSGVLSSSHARTLLGAVVVVEHIEEIAKMIIEQDWSVRKTENFVKKLQNEPVKKMNIPQREEQDKATLEQQLSTLLNCAVHIKMNGKKPTLRCHFDSSIDLQRFVQRLNQNL